MTTEFAVWQNSDWKFHVIAADSDASDRTTQSGIFDGSTWRILKSLPDYFGILPKYRLGESSLSMFSGFFKSASTASEYKKITSQAHPPVAAIWTNTLGFQEFRDTTQIEITTKGVACVRNSVHGPQLIVGGKLIAGAEEISTCNSTPSLTPLITFKKAGESFFLGRDGIVYSGTLGTYWGGNRESEASTMSVQDVAKGGWWTIASDAFGKAILCTVGKAIPFEPSGVGNPVIITRPGLEPIVASSSGPIIVAGVSGNRLMTPTSGPGNYELRSVSKSGTRLIWGTPFAMIYVNSQKRDFQSINIPAGEYVESITWTPDEKVNFELRSSRNDKRRLLTVSEEN